MIEVNRTLNIDEENATKLDQFPQTKEMLEGLIKEVLHSFK
jgi:hypothetical protein